MKKYRNLKCARKDVPFPTEMGYNFHAFMYRRTKKQWKNLHRKHARMDRKPAEDFAWAYIRQRALIKGKRIWLEIPISKTLSEIIGHQ